MPCGKITDEMREQIVIGKRRQEVVRVLEEMPLTAPTAPKIDMIFCLWLRGATEDDLQKTKEYLTREV